MPEPRRWSGGWNGFSDRDLGFDAAVRPHLGAWIRQCDGNGLGMDIQPDMSYELAHGVPEW